LPQLNFWIDFQTLRVAQPRPPLRA
jgi:hypothetical protein